GPVFAYEVLRASGAAAITPNQTISFPDTPSANKTSVGLLVRNIGSADGKLTDVAILGGSFQLADLPFFPVLLRAGDSVTFSVTFVPAEAGPATGRLRVGNDTFNLSGAGVGVALAFTYEIQRGAD